MNENEKATNQYGQGSTNQTDLGAKYPTPNQENSKQEPCVKKVSLKETLDKQNWANQLDQIESQCDQKLKDCLKQGNDDLLKLYEEISKEADKYSQEYENLSHQLECMIKNNESDLEKVPADVTKEIDPIITEANNKIKDLEKCKEKLECSVESECECDDSKYPLLKSKPTVKLDCTQAGRENLTTLLSAKDGLERSNRYHDTKQKEFDDLKKTLITIQDYLKKVKDYHDKAGKAKDESKLCLRYAYLLLIKTILDETQIKFVSEENLETQLLAALQNLGDAKTDKCYREYTKNKTEAILGFVAQNYDDAVKNWEATIIKKIIKTKK